MLDGINRCINGLDKAKAQRLMAMALCLSVTAMAAIGFLGFGTTTVSAATDTSTATNEMLLMFIGLIPLVFAMNIMSDFLMNRRGH